jgi:hypothetical protein
MTALSEFERLEATALWRRTPDDQRREVLVTLGDATLTISEFSGAVLAHWSIPAVRRANGNARPAIYHPDGDPGETLEFAADETPMIDGIDRLLRAIDRRRPHPGKLRLVLAGLFFILALGFSVFWLPGALERYATAVVPAVQRAEIGRMALAQLTRVTGQPCAAPGSAAPLRRLGDRVLGVDAARLVVLPTELRVTAHLPGPILLLSRSVFEDHENPEIAAGFILAEATRVSESDALAEILDAAGIVATLRLLTTGVLPDTALSAYTETLLTEAMEPLDPETLLRRFDSAGLRSTPYAYALDPTGETTLDLIEADPYPAGTAPVLSDADWVRLQGICGA